MQCSDGGACGGVRWVRLWQRVHPDGRNDGAVVCGLWPYVLDLRQPRLWRRAGLRAVDGGLCEPEGLGRQGRVPTVWAAGHAARVPMRVLRAPRPAGRSRRLPNHLPPLRRSHGRLRGSRPVRPPRGSGVVLMRLFMPGWRCALTGRVSGRHNSTNSPNGARIRFAMASRRSGLGRGRVIGQHDLPGLPALLDDRWRPQV